jgi:hypothetical protein
MNRVGSILGEEEKKEKIVIHLTSTQLVEEVNP